MAQDKTFRALRLDSGAVITKFDTDGTMTANSNVYVPTQKAVKTYVDVTRTGTTNASFTIDSDATTGNIKIQPTSGSVDRTLTLTNVALTNQRTITFPDDSGTVALTNVVEMKGVRDIPGSFENSEQGGVKTYFPFKVIINKVRIVVTRTMADTDHGQFYCGNKDGTTNNGPWLVAAQATVSTCYSYTPTVYNEVLANDYFHTYCVKPTAGGRILVSLEYTRTA